MVTPSLLQSVVAIAREAGAAIMTHYASDPVVTWKDDRSPLTAADLAAQQVILQRLGEVSPGIPVVSEEGWIPTPAEQGSLERFWLVDPLDGTKEFVSRNGEFTVNIALIENAEPVLGVVCAPAVHLLYSAAIGQGAWKDDGRGAPVRLASAPRAPGEALTVVESRSHPSPELEDWLRGVRVRRRVAAGSSLKLCWVADGTADAYPRFGPTMEWDVAAGDCVFRWSGRHGPRQSPLRYNKPGLRNGPFILGLDQVDNRVQ